MKRSNLMLLAIGVTIIMMGCSKEDHLVIEPDQNDPLTASLKSGKPAPNLVGTMELDFDLTAIWPEDPVWVGTVSFEGYGTYGIRFFHLSPFKEYSQASPFEEYFEILDESGSVVLGGPDEGVTVLANKPPEPTKYVMNGEIDTAIDPFEGWMGRHVHMSGVITWQVLELPDGTTVVAPATAPGTIRIN